MDNMTSLNISLPETLKTFVESETASGGYSSASEYIRDQIRQAMRRKANDKVQALIDEALASPAEPMTDADWDALRKRAEELAAKKYREVS